MTVLFSSLLMSYIDVFILPPYFYRSAFKVVLFLLIPLIAPLAELVGLTSQVAVQAFCFGDGFSNLLYPTNAILMITLGLTVVSYPKWFRFTIGLQAFVMIANILLLMLAVLIGYGA